MAEMSLEEKMRYYNELSLQLKRKGFEIPGLSPLNELLVDWQGARLCVISTNDGCRFLTSEANRPGAEVSKNQAADIGRTVAEYMRLMEKAPPLKASGLEGDYRALAEFNGAVLAGHPTHYGVQFITWVRDYSGEGVCWGHYYDEDYAAAKADFAKRAGLVAEDQLFSPEQLTEAYRAIRETLDSEYPPTEERRKVLEETAQQIEYAVPDLSERVSLSNQKELEAGMRYGQTM